MCVCVMGESIIQSEENNTGRQDKRLEDSDLGFFEDLHSLFWTRTRRTWATGADQNLCWFRSRLRRIRRALLDHQAG